MAGMHGERKRLEILEAGLALWRQGGSAAVTARAVGKMVNLTHAGVLHHCHSSSGLRDAVAEWAVRCQDGTIVPQLIVMGHKAVSDLTAEQRAEYLSGLTRS